VRPYDTLSIPLPG